MEIAGQVSSWRVHWLSVEGRFDPRGTVKFVVFWSAALAFRLSLRCFECDSGEQDPASGRVAESVVS